MGNDLGLPGVKDPPPDEPSLLSKLGDSVKDAAIFSGLGFTVTLLIIAGVIISGLYFFSKTKVSAGA